MAPWHEQLAAVGAGGPWLEPWREPARRVIHQVLSGAPLDDALNACAGEDGLGARICAGGRCAPAVRFVPATSLPSGVAYEQFIFETGQCPTRENLHDFFNGLAWLALPLAKRQLNCVQAAEIRLHGVAGARGPVRDAVTLFDEGGAVLHAPDAIWQALVARDWRRLFVELRSQWSQARLLVVGHALLEKLARPRKDLTAHVWARRCPVSDVGGIDRWLAGELTAERLADKPFTPLPVLGIPGWCDENRNLSFYEDARVFRPPAVGAGRKTPTPTTASPS